MTGSSMTLPKTLRQARKVSGPTYSIPADWATKAAPQIMAARTSSPLEIRCNFIEVPRFHKKSRLTVAQLRANVNGVRCKAAQNMVQ